MKINYRLNNKIRNYTAIAALFIGTVAAICDIISDKPILLSSLNSTRSQNSIKVKYAKEETDNAYFINQELKRLHELAEQEIAINGYVSYETKNQIEELNKKL